MTEIQGTQKQGTEKQHTEKQGLDARLTGLAAAVGTSRARGPAPVHLWHPPYCGEIDLRIAADGTWFYAGTPITRRPMVELFAGILRKDPERFVLVTPVECVGIVVEDAPFVAVAMASEGGQLRFVTNVGNEVACEADHPLRFETDADGGVRPYVRVRDELWARLTRSLAVDLLDLAEASTVDGRELLGVRSGAAFFAIGPAEA